MDACPVAALQDAPPRVQVLHPGDVAWGRRGDCLQTLLGSCVSVLLGDPRGTVGAMCHIVHAETDHASLPRLRALLRAQAIEPRLCVAWVVGGGNMFPALYARDPVGEANVRHVLQALHDDGIRIAGEDHGGAVYRRVSWTIGSGPPRVTAVPLDE